MPSVSNIAIGANMAAAAATKARHGMNESIARLSTGVRAMYGGDAAGYSMGQQTKAVSQSYAQATRNIEDAMSFAQQGESVLLEVANLAQRLRELAITADNAAILDANQEAALNSEAALIGDTITAVLDKTDLNTFEVVDSAAAKEYTIAYASLTANTTEVGPNVSIASQAGITAAAGAEATSGTSYETGVGWVGVTTYNDNEGNLRVKKEILVAMSGITTGNAPVYGNPPV